MIFRTILPCHSRPYPGIDNLFLKSPLLWHNSYGKDNFCSFRIYINSKLSKRRSYEDNNILKSASATRKTNGADVTVSFAAKNIKNENNPTIYVTVSGEDGAVVASGKYIPEATESTHTFNLSFTPEAEKNYKVRAFLMSGELKPLYNDIYCTF